MLKIAVGVIRNHLGEVLISKRADNAHQGGLWEFPGGKLEEGESSFDALKRELFEELNITITAALPLTQIKHHYSDIAVHLDVYEIGEFQGGASGMEGQPIKWVAVSKLKNHLFPKANKRIIDVLMLPHFYPIIDDSDGDEEAMLEKINRLISCGYTMLQLRAKSLNEYQFKRLAKESISLCKKSGVRLFLNTTVETAIELKAEAVHLSAQEIERTQTKKALTDGLLMAASCHNAEELSLAYEKGVLFAVLSPVRKTQTHVAAEPLGWNKFNDLASTALLPVFALGGLGPKDMQAAKLYGAHGISGISLF